MPVTLIGLKPRIKRALASVSIHILQILWVELEQLNVK
jgi:hypothetical protein